MARRPRFGVARRKLVDKIGVRRWTSKFNLPDYGDWLTVSDQKILLGTSDYRDLYVTSFIDQRNEEGETTIQLNKVVRSTQHQIHEFIQANWLEFKQFSFGQDNFLIDMEDGLIEVASGKSVCEFRFHGAWAWCQKQIDFITANFEPIGAHVRWVYDADMSSISVPLDMNRHPVAEMYPFLGEESLEDYYDRFTNSMASVLILIGPPGTGKTSFIKGLLNHTEQSAMVCYDEKILSDDALFAAFIDGDSKLLVVEDADLFLSSRANGNNMMHKFLNVGDGLVTLRDKKIIFSTNLPSVKDIDEALLRPGRCHDVLEFGQLDLQQAKALAEKKGIPFEGTEDKKYSVAEVFTQGLNQAPRKKRKFGFI